MEKQTLSNYGWIVVVTLVLAVMLALATPFGTYVGDGVVSIANGFVGASDNAIDEDNIAKLGQKWDEKLNSSDNTENTETTAPDPALNPNNGTEPQDGDTYEYGDYKYTYSTSDGGWSVAVLDKSKTEYGAILESINGQPVTDMSYTFSDCENLTTAPVIPNTVTNMFFTFKYCPLTTAPAIPSSVTNMEATFIGCMGLTGNIEINANPTSYHDCFYDTEKPITLSGSSTL